MAEECKLFRPPTIVFDQNILIAEDKGGKIKLVFNAKEAMRFMNHDFRKNKYNPPEAPGQINTISFIPPKLFVQHAQHWKNIEKPKDIEITEVK